MNHTIKLPKLYDWQKDVATSSKRHRLICASRRSGKTLTSRTIAIKHLLEGKKVLWIAPVFAQVIEQWQEMFNVLEPIISNSQKNKEITLITKGKLWCRSADNPSSLRSLGYDLVVMDEAAFMDEDTWTVIRPTLSDHGTGRAVLISTPNGFNHFHEMFVKYQTHPDWLVIQKDWTASPHLTKDEIDKAKEDLTPSQFRQEYEAQFISPKGALFEPEWLENIFVDIMPTSWVRSAIGTDYSLGGSSNSDLQSVVFACWVGNTLYCDCYSDRMSIDAFNRKIKQIYDHYKPESISVETNFLQHLDAHNLLKLWEPNPPPVIHEVCNKVKKEVRISRLATLLARKQLKILNNAGGIQAFHELSDFGGEGSKTHDDTIDAIEQAYRTMIET